MKSPGETLTIRVVGSIADVDAAAWDALDHGPSPFLRHGFLRALEESNWNVSGAARILGMERTNLHKRIRALGIERVRA